MNELHEKLRACRKLAGYSQRQLAEISGLPTSAISYWESGRNVPSYYNAEAYLNACGFELVIRRKEGEE